MRDRGFESKRRVYPLSRNHDRESTNGFLSAVIEKGAFDRKAPKSEAMGPRSEARTEKTKKRKYSPIIWDRDERRQPDIGSKRSNMTGKVLSVNETLAPLAPQTELSDMLAISPRHSGTDDRENELGQIEEDEDFYVNETLAPLAPQTELSDMLVISPQHSGMDDGENELGQIEEDEDFHVNETLAPLAPQTELSDMLVISPQHSGMDDGDNELGQIEEDEDFYAVARTISSSRWADKDDFDIAAPEKKTNISPLEKNTIKKVQSRSSGSDRGEREEDCMVVDGGEGANRSDHSSVRGYESEFSREETPVQSNSNPPKRRINMLQGCRLVDEFDRLNKISEGTYGVVYRARDKKTGEVVALKKVKMEKEKDGFPLTSLREINILLSLNHPSIVDVKEVVMGSSLDSIFMVMEYMEHDLKGVMDTMKQPYSQSEVKCLILQLLEGVSYLHDNWILHRDLKTSNLLVDNCGNLKICDFGLARQYGSPLKPYTPLVVTLWYRAPELLLGAKEYSTAIDMWSVGCIMAELLSKEPLFDGRSEKEQLSKIFSILGSPNEKIWPGYKNLPGAKVAFPKQPYNRLREKFPATSFSGRPMLSVAGFDLLNKLLTYDPEKRISAEEALRHPWFSEVPLPKSKDFMPTFPAHNDKDRTVRQRVMKRPDPIEEHLKAAIGREPWRIRLG